MNDMEGGRPMDNPTRCQECNGVTSGIHRWHKMDCSKNFEKKEEEKVSER